MVIVRINELLYAEFIYVLLSSSLLLLSRHVGLVMQTKEKLPSLPLVAICSPPRSSATPDASQTFLPAAERSMDALPGHLEGFRV